MNEPEDTEFVTAAFSALDDVEPSAGLRRRVAEIPIVHPRVVSPTWPLGRLWQSVLAFAALGVLGTLTGLASVSDEATAGLDVESGLPAKWTVIEGEQTTSLEDPLEGMFALALSESWNGWNETGTEVLALETSEVSR